jgi:hypothetical protein
MIYFLVYIPKGTRFIFIFFIWIINVIMVFQIKVLSSIFFLIKGKKF